jgi:hypothetical protein
MAGTVKDLNCRPTTFERGRAQPRRELFVDGGTRIASQLAVLGDAAGDLADDLEVLHDLVVLAVPSSVGLSFTVRVAAVNLTLTTVPADANLQSSLRVPLGDWVDAGAGSQVVFYAANPGALVDLAADLGWALNSSITWEAESAGNTLVLDRDLEPTLRGPSITGLEDLAAVNQAMGVLLGNGSTPETAVTVLQLAAAAADTSIGAAAATLITELVAAARDHRVDLSAMPIRAAWTGSTAPGDHICGLYRGEQERDGILAAYLGQGLRSGDKCLCLVDRTEPLELRRRLLAEPDWAGKENAHDLDIRSASDGYLPGGRFVPGEMIDLLSRHAADAASTDTSRRFRATGEMSWVLRNAPGSDQFFQYESDLNKMQGNHAPTLLCLFDLADLDEQGLERVLQTHPTILFDNTVRHSTYYQGPEHRLVAT